MDEENKNKNDSKEEEEEIEIEEEEEENDEQKMASEMKDSQMSSNINQSKGDVSQKMMEDK